jgi:hypothetical protein
MSISLDSITYPNLDMNTTGPPLNGPANIVGANNGTGIPLALIVIIIIIIAYFAVFSSLGNERYVDTSVNSTSSSSDSHIGLFLWGLFVLLILLNGMAYIFSIDIIASIKNIFSPVTTIDIKAKGASASASGGANGGILNKKKQVFHVSDNKYNYEDAKAICSAFDGRLATYNELNQAYNEGADWCGYGWSDKQMALFPTQEEKWQQLQKIDGHHNDCGRPGINGGFIDNPDVKFGINCYGVKPEISAMEAENMQNEQLYPKTKKEVMFDKKVDYWRSKLPDVMVSPFNSDNWSVI